MKLLSILFSMLIADFFERTRRYSFLVTICLVIYLGYAVGTGQIFLKLGNYRGIYNSAWIGSLMSLVITFFMGLFGFYLVKNSIQQDEQTGVGQIIAATPLTRVQYLLGKWLGSFAILATMVAILGIAAFFMQLITREEVTIQVWPLMAPFLFIALPMMALVSALAIFFESVSSLKGGFGNLVYFGLFNLIFVAGVELPELHWLDVTGFNLVATEMKTVVHATFPAYDNSFTLSMASTQPLETFVFPGIYWTPSLIIERLFWLVISVGIVMISSYFFNRFDATKALYRVKQNTQPSDLSLIETRSTTIKNEINITSLTPLVQDFSFRKNYLWLIWLECLLLLKGLKWYWLAGMAIFWLGGIAAPTEDIRKYWYMLIALWPVLVWSKMGEREFRNQAEQLVYQGAHPVYRLLISSWMAGILITVFLTSSVLIGRLIHGDASGWLPWVLSNLFIPTLALLLGVWTRSSKVFEVVYPILWYLGPFNHESQLAILDYLGIHTRAPVNTQPLFFAEMIFTMLILVVLGKRCHMIQ